MAHRFLPLAAFVAIVPLGAQAQPADVIVGSWRISHAIPGTCQAIGRIDQLTLNLSIRKASGDGFVFLQSAGWSFTKSETHAGTVSWDGWKSAQPLDFTSMTIGGDGVLTAPVDKAFLQSLGGAGHLWVKVPSAALDGDFPIADADKVVAALTACLTTP
jgi:hypothetical protein